MTEPWPTTNAPVEDEGVIRVRAEALTEYLLAVRALLEKPSRGVPTADAYWQHELPGHPACEFGPQQPGGSWLRVGRPGGPQPPQIPTGLLRHLVWDLSATATPTLAEDADEPAPEEVRAEFARWYEDDWLPWSTDDAAAQATRALHDRLYDLRYRLDIDAARVELVWGHVVLDATVAGERVHYPLIATRWPWSTTPTPRPSASPRRGRPGCSRTRSPTSTTAGWPTCSTSAPPAGRSTSTRGTTRSARTSAAARCAASASNRRCARRGASRYAVRTSTTPAFSSYARGSA